MLGAGEGGQEMKLRAVLERHVKGHPTISSSVTLSTSILMAAVNYPRNLKFVGLYHILNENVEINSKPIVSFFF